MRPPTAMPNVTAGFTCPPEAFAAMYTADESAKAFAIATITRLDGSAAASGNNFLEAMADPTTAKEAHASQSFFRHRFFLESLLPWHPVTTHEGGIAPI